MPTPDQRKIDAIVSRLLEWYARNARDLPWRRTTDPYGVHVSEIMLQQTQVKTVIPYWERWMRELPDIGSLARAGEGRIHKLWEGLGYYTRVRNLQKAARLICARHGGVFPTRFEDILALPGIGRYTAGAIASIAFNQPAPILDGNVIRVLTRLHGIDGDPRDGKVNARLWRLAEALVRAASDRAPRKRDGKPRMPLPCSALNQSLMELGALVCTARSPDCDACPIARQCFARREERTGDFPRRRAGAAVTSRRVIALVIECDGRYLVRQRGSGVVNAKLWEFPNLEVPEGETAEAVVESLCGEKPVFVRKLCTLRHSITRYRIRTESYRVGFEGKKGAIAGVAGLWRTPAQLRRLAFTAAHRKIAIKTLTGTAQEGG